MRFTAIFSLSISLIFSLAMGQTVPSAPPSSPPTSHAAAPEDAPDTQPSIHATDLLGPIFSSQVHGISFRPPLNSVRIDKSAPDSIVEYDLDAYNWQLKAWSVRLQRSLPLTIHKDQFGDPQDGVMEVTLANIKQQSPDVQVLRNEVITVGRVRVGMLAVRYETAAHDRRFTQQAIFEAPDADHRLYYFLDLTGPGKPELEPDDITNPAEKLAFDTFKQVVDSTVLLDRSAIADFQKQSLYASMGLFVIWTGNNYAMLRNGITPDQYRRVLGDGQDIGYEHIVENFEPNDRSPEESILRIGVISHMANTPGRTWDTQTWMFSSVDRAHEHWKTAARCTDPRAQILDSYSQVGVSDEQTKAYALQPAENPDGSLLPEGETAAQPAGPLGQGNVDIETRRSLEVTTTHGNMQLNPFRIDTPAFYIPQAFSFILPELLPPKPKTYMFATFVASTPQNSSASTPGDVMARYLEVLPAQHVTFHGQDFDAIPVTDKITLDGPITTTYLNDQGKFLGSTTTVPDGDKSTTIEVIPSDSETIGHIWNQPDLTAPAAPENQ